MHRRDRCGYCAWCGWRYRSARARRSTMRSNGRMSSLQRGGSSVLWGVWAAVLIATALPRPTHVDVSYASPRLAPPQRQVGPPGRSTDRHGAAAVACSLVAAAIALAAPTGEAFVDADVLRGGAALLAAPPVGDPFRADTSRCGGCPGRARPPARCCCSCTNGSPVRSRSWQAQRLWSCSHGRSIDSRNDGWFSCPPA